MSSSISNQKIHIITTTNEIDTYYSFLPTSYISWKKIFPNCVYVLGVITSKNEDSDFVKRCKELSDVCYVFKPLKDIESGVQAKTTRMYLSTLFDNSIAMIIDIDYYLLNKQFLYDNIAPVFTEEDKIICIGFDGYKDTADEGKWQMNMTTSRSSFFQKIINPQKLEYEEWFYSKKNIKNPIDNKESVGNKFENFSDESLLRYLVVNYPQIDKFWIKVDRGDFKHYRAEKRIDRGWWGKSYNKFKLQENYYIDSQPLRPFDLHVNKLKPLLEYIGFDNEDLKDSNIFFKKKIVRRCR